MSQTTASKTGKGSVDAASGNDQQGGTVLDSEALADFYEKQLVGTGIYCTGVVSSVVDEKRPDYNDKSKTNNHRNITLSTENGAVLWRNDDRDDELPNVRKMQKIRIRVEWCKSEKGALTVMGKIES